MTGLASQPVVSAESARGPVCNLFARIAKKRVHVRPCRAVLAKVKAREDSLLSLSQQSAMCPIGVGAAPFGWTETRRLTDEDALTAMAPLPGTDAAAAASSRKSGLISQQSAMCQVDAGAAPSGGPETKELTDKAAPGAPGARRGAGR